MVLGVNDQDIPMFPFLDSIQSRCLEAGLTQCQSRRCWNVRSKLDAIMPSCETWNAVRDWVLIATSCQVSADAAGYRWKDRFTAFSFQQLLKETVASDNRSDPYTTFQVQELIYFWLKEISTRISSPAISRYDYRNHIDWFFWNRDSIMHRHVTLPAVKKATTAAKNLNICPNRLWNLARNADRGQNDLPALIRIVENTTAPSSFAHPDHDSCSTEFCQFSDENSTLKEQLHKCLSRSCRVITFPSEEVNEAVMEGRPTAWRTGTMNFMHEDNSFTITPAPESYIAISHVWSDGTGVGLKLLGQVNSCLFSYFSEISRTLGCEGIWWDTICVPTDRRARRKALSDMHLNYWNAEHTVIHDEYLINFPWADDGSPAIALVLSPWFTRGWTALELSMSSSVKVIYRDPHDPRKQVLKDLDTDVLAQGFSSLGHSVASALIQRLRGFEPSLFDLLKVLSTRTTSWARDRLCIAGLFARAQNFSYDDPPSEMTRKIVRTYSAVPRRLLLHGHVTLSNWGGLSWCPYNLLDSELTMTRDRDEQELMKVDGNGAALGIWSYRQLSFEDQVRLLPYSFHISVDYRIREALLKWQHCVILRSNVRQNYDSIIAILVAVTGTSIIPSEEDPTYSSYHIDCHYVGCVLDKIRMPNESIGDTLPFRIGCEADKPSRPAEEVLQQFYDISEVQPSLMKIPKLLISANTRFAVRT